MKHFIPTLTFAASLFAIGAAFAQAPAEPAKGNAPLKPAHTVNDGGARLGHNSFTEGQARQHIEKSGFTAVTGLVKGQDGVWRGKATRAGQVSDVAMDFKGNVTTPTAAANSSPAPMPMARSNSMTTTAATPAAGASTTSTMAAAGHGAMRHHRRHHRHHRHRHAMTGAHAGSCATPGANGVACSGVDRNHNGISDKEDRAIRAGAKP